MPDPREGRLAHKPRKEDGDEHKGDVDLVLQDLGIPLPSNSGEGISDNEYVDEDEKSGHEGRQEKHGDKFNLVLVELACELELDLCVRCWTYA